ncbi:8-oxo-dGTP diphosphatase MutT [Methylomonas sp. Kb3]|uniref:NUDIX domain-containing protein n=1 Tax=Methylomonas sp. Kb3 TaxID=1611544 RepID=UPI000C32E316|nr:NUDIX domain-containing protein [Methylomonas sp. Kb3]PKD38264.1 8-oxo-dGTP diphosphatase MutT [Methylomonas sp. Kb3]
MLNSDRKILSVVSGVIAGQNGRILLAKRPTFKSNGDMWELPGGKKEGSETAFETLKRELAEEIGVHVFSAEYLTCVKHDYVDYSVSAEGWFISHYHGEPSPCEGQTLLWANKQLIANLNMVPTAIDILSIIFG